jgi:hypothetical protein
MLRLLVAVFIIYLVVSCKDSDKNSSKLVERPLQILSYEQLLDYPNQCALADQQLKQLRWIQRAKNFDPDPDNLTEADRLYNSRLKATIWWYAYTCNKS